MTSPKSPSDPSELETERTSVVSPTLREPTPTARPPALGPRLRQPQEAISPPEEPPRRESLTLPKYRGDADLDALYERAVLLTEEGNLEDAARIAVVCLEEAPHDKRPYLIAAVVYQEQGKLDIARTMLELAIDIDPSCPEARLRMAIVHERTRHIRGHHG